jgi:hypothetical protein
MYDGGNMKEAGEFIYKQREIDQISFNSERRVNYGKIFRSLDTKIKKIFISKKAK